jgi:hypothetical protein
MRKSLLGIALAAIMLLSLFTMAASAATPISAGTHASVVVNDGFNQISAFGTSEVAPWYLTHKTLNAGKWSEWENLGGQMIYSPVAVSRKSLTTDVFVTGYVAGSPYGAVWTKTLLTPDGQWSAWKGLGGSTGHGPAVCSWASYRLDVFATGTDNRVYQKYSNDGGATWSGWISLGGQAKSGPDATANYAGGQLQVSCTGINDQPYIKNWNGHQWSEWKRVYNGPAVVHDHPCMTSVSDKIYLFAVEEGTGIVWYTNSTSSYSKWQQIPVGVISSSPDAAITSDGLTLYFFGRGQDKAVWYTSLDTANGKDTWSDWQSIGGVFP